MAPPRPEPEPPAADELVTVTQLAAELGITARTVRFYEDKGLIKPSRAGAIRVYTRRELARMKLILRGKRLGFSLRDIKEFLDLYDADRTKHAQMKRLVEQVRIRQAALVDQRTAITQTLEELAQIEREAAALLDARSTARAAPKRP